MFAPEHFIGNESPKDIEISIFLDTEAHAVLARGVKDSFVFHVVIGGKSRVTAEKVFYQFNSFQVVIPVHESIPVSLKEVRREHEDGNYPVKNRNHEDVQAVGGVRDAHVGNGDFVRILFIFSPENDNPVIFPGGEVINGFEYYRKRSSF